MKKPLKVLILEDERLTARSLALDIMDLGAKVINQVVKSEDAVGIALEQKPDLIIMDVRLTGGLDGIEVSEEIHKKRKFQLCSSVVMRPNISKSVLKKSTRLHLLKNL
ncbi:response regulator [bacterium]|nr:response regulator [bacterium]